MAASPRAAHRGALRGTAHRLRRRGRLRVRETRPGGPGPFPARLRAVPQHIGQDGLAGLLDAHPQGSKDARARIKAYGGQGWDVRWTRTSEFAGVWKVDIAGTAGPKNRPVRVTETITWEKAHWVMTPLPGVVPTPPDAAGILEGLHAYPPTPR
jgi:hypothetical protein